MLVIAGVFGGFPAVPKALSRVRLPGVAQLAQLDEHGLLVGLVGQVREGLAQARDHARAVQAEEGVDLLLEPEGGHQRRGRVLLGDLGQQFRRPGVVRLPVEGEFQVVGDVVVARVDQGRIGRTLLKVKIEDGIKADKIFSTLSGKDVQQRREYIETHALDVKNLDV